MDKYFSVASSSFDSPFAFAARFAFVHRDRKTPSLQSDTIVGWM
jgi:hypothetical protein